MPEIIDSRGYQLVGKIPESDALARGLASMMQRRDRVNSEAKNRETMREAGILSGVYNIQDDAESNAYIDAMIARSTNDVERGELEQLKSYDLNTRRNIARQALTSKGLGAMIPGQDNGAGWQAYKGQDQQIQVDTDEDGQPIYQDYAVVIRTNARTGQTENIQEPLSKPYKQDGSPIIGMKAATAGAVSRATEAGKTGAVIESAPDIQRIKASEAAAVEAAKGGAQVQTEKELAPIKAEGKRLEAQAIDTQKAATGAINSFNSIGIKLKALDEGIDALDKGANAGVIYSKLPSFNAETIKLEKAAANLGLGTLAEATFGSLSEKELDLVLTKDIPMNMNSQELSAYLKEKRDAMKKAQAVMLETANFLSQPGNTPAMWLNKRQGGNVQSDNQPQATEWGNW